jgi:uncharacterized protein
MAVLIFKPTESCNSNCIYCEVVKTPKTKFMSFDLLELVFQRIDEFLVEHPTENFDLTWHGGEACLLGVEYFRKALELQNKHCARTQNRIQHLIQSNLTLITQDLIDSLRALGINNVGSSYDPVPHVRGFGKDRDSDAYNAGFFRGIELLRRNKMGWGFIYVVHRRSLEHPLDLFHHLANLNVSSAPNFHPVRIFYEDKESVAITGEEFADFLGPIFKTWWENRERYGAVQPFQWYADTLISRRENLPCDFAGVCAYHWFFLSPEGEASHCGIAGDYRLLSYGQIQKRSIWDILHDSQRDPMVRRQTTLPQTLCRDCRCWPICHGGCPVSAWRTNGTFESRAPSCEETRIFMERYFEPITGWRPETDHPPGEAVQARG